MQKLKVPYVDLPGQHKPLKRAILASVGKALDRGDFILGGAVAELEKNFAKYCGTKYAIGLNSGTDALFLALKACGVGPGDEVITAPNSFLASATSIRAAGAKPVFVDVRDDQNIDPFQIEAACTTRTRAIMPVHLTGKAADMDPILAMAKRRNLAVIEDAAQAIGTEYKGRRAGNLGTAGCFSLHPLKTLNACGDGGMLTTNDEKIYTTIMQLRNIGLKNRTESDIWGFNSRLDTIQASIVDLKLKLVDRWIAQRRKNADYYRKHLANVVECPKDGADERSAYHLFVIQADRRDELQKFLLDNGVDTKIHYPIPIHLQKCAAELGLKRGDFPNVERQSQRILSIPIYQTLTKKQQDLVIKLIRQFFGK